MEYILQEKRDLPTRGAEVAVFFIVLIFLFGYFNYKPLEHSNRIINGGFEYIFYALYHLVYITLGIVHEGGHGVCYILHTPQIITALNGTLFQLLFPLLVGLYYLRRGNYLAFYIAIFILGVSFDFTSWYISISNEGLYVPAYKSFLGQEGYHDFNYILTYIGLIDYYKGISIFVHILSYLLMVISLFAIFFRVFITNSGKNL